jgi:LacI family transcriptional regulator
MARLVDVARKAGVSISTASYVVTGSRSVGDETRRRVLEAIAETGYTPDAVARALRSSRSQTVALVVPDIRNPFFTALIDGVEAEARANGQSLVMVNTGEDPEREVAALRDLRAQRVDGFIIGLTRQTPKELVKSLQDSKKPFVLVDRAGPAGVDQVTVANDVAAKVMTDHLIGLGHRRIGIVAGARGISTAEDRLSGYRAALEGAGIPFDESLVIAGGSRRDVARLAVTEALRRPDRPHALVVTNNDMTLGALEAIAALGLKIPSDIAIVSLDDLPWAGVLSSPLTAVAQPSFAMGREAMRLLLRRVQTPDAPPRWIRLRPEFVHRQSCGCAAAAADALGEAGTTMAEAEEVVRGGEPPEIEE